MARVGAEDALHLGLVNKAPGTELSRLCERCPSCPGSRGSEAGGAGGVAGFAIQLAKNIGAYVVTTASEQNHEYVRGLGADEIIDYNAVDFTKAVSNCDAVFETVGGDTSIKSFNVLKPGGRAAFIASGMKSPEPTRNDVQSLRPVVGRDRNYMERVADLLKQGVVTLPAQGGVSLSATATVLFARRCERK